MIKKACRLPGAWIMGYAGVDKRIGVLDAAITPAKMCDKAERASQSSTCRAKPVSAVFLPGRFEVGKNGEVRGGTGRDFSPAVNSGKKTHGLC